LKDALTQNEAGYNIFSIKKQDILGSERLIFDFECPDLRKEEHIPYPVLPALSKRSASKGGFWILYSDLP
jgi:hypothetical protein